MRRSPASKCDALLKGIEADKIGILTLKEIEDVPFQENVQSLLPGARSIIVLAMELFQEVTDFLTSKKQYGELSRRDFYTSNTDMVNGRINWETYKIVKNLHKEGFKGIPLPASGGPYDGRFLKGILSYKQAGEAAGLGVIGWHSLLITPEYGPRVRLGGVVTDALLTSTPSSTMDNPCIKCRGACVKICPAGAISEPGRNQTCVVDKYLCNTYITACGMCAECIRVCPAGRTGKHKPVTA